MKQALFISSPIGLGHARRDVAIARELRTLVPDLLIDWLAQDPVTRVLASQDEHIHPASDDLVSESAHIESEAADHDLHCFHTLRRMDEILISNFMVFHDLVTAESYDVWIADEGWEIDYYLHEHPELKRAPYVWLTDFVGFLPTDDADDYERFLTEDYNAQMVEHIARSPHVRDRALFVGSLEDIVDAPLGERLPAIADWTQRHFSFTGYISGLDPVDEHDRAKLRARLGYDAHEQVCVVSVGGSGVGESLLRRVIEAYPMAKQQAPGLRMIVVAGPRIDPTRLPRPDDLEVLGYVPDLYLHLAACDLAVVQGGLSTAMELTANGRPFIYVPLRHHFEQQIHVTHRLNRYRAGTRLDYHTSPPEVLASAIAEQLGRTPDYRPVETGGAARAARAIAELL